MIPLLAGERTLRAGIAMVEARGGPSVLGAGLITARTLADAEAMAEICRASGWDAVAVSGETPRKDRARLKARIQAGESLVLVTVKLLSEGVDIPNLRWLLPAAPLSAGMRVYLAQVIGRVVRSAPGKTRALVFDPAAQLQIFGLVHAPALGAERALKPLPKAAKRAAALVLADLEKLPYAVRMGRLELWAASLRMAVERVEAERSMGVPRLGHGERMLPTPARWWATLAELVKGKSKGLGLLRQRREPGQPKPQGDRHREMIKVLVEGKSENLPRGVAHDLSVVLRLLNMRWEERCREEWRGAFNGKGSMEKYQRAAFAARVVVRVEVPGRF